MGEAENIYFTSLKFLLFFFAFLKPRHKQPRKLKWPETSIALSSCANASNLTNQTSKRKAKVGPRMEANQPNFGELKRTVKRLSMRNSSEWRLKSDSGGVG